MISSLPEALLRAHADDFRISSRISHKRDWRPRSSRAAGWATLAASVLLLAGCKSEQPVRVETVRPVRTAVATLSAPTRTLVYAGSIKPRYESSLGFRVGGKISERLVNVGDRVNFAVDSSTLDEAARQTVERQAAWLQQFPTVTVTI